MYHVQIFSFILRLAHRLSLISYYPCMKVCVSSGCVGSQKPELPVFTN